MLCVGDEFSGLIDGGDRTAFRAGSGFTSQDIDKELGTAGGTIDDAQDVGVSSGSGVGGARSWAVPELMFISSRMVVFSPTASFPETSTRYSPSPATIGAFMPILVRFASFLPYFSARMLARDCFSRCSSTFTGEFGSRSPTSDRKKPRRLGSDLLEFPCIIPPNGWVW